MKKMLTLCFVTALLAGCGASSHVSSQDAIDIGYGTQDKDHVTTSVSNLKVKKTDAQTYSNMYDYLRGRVPGVMVGSDNRIIVDVIKDGSSAIYGMRGSNGVIIINTVGSHGN